MINKTLKEKLKNWHGGKFSMDGIELKATREGFGDALLDLGIENDNVVALCADLTESVQMHKFRDKFPERFVQLGIAEQNMASVASGMSVMGKIPFIASYAMFSPGRNWEQIRTTICYNNTKVIIVGAHAGLSVGPDGGTHQALEDIAILNAIPNITILNPIDYVEAYQMTKLAYELPGPVYIRLAREKTPIILDINTIKEKAKINKILDISESYIKDKTKVGLIVSGPLAFEGILASYVLDREGVGVSILNINQIKELDTNLIINFAKENKNIVTLEEHQINGGLGSIVASILSRNFPTRICMIAVNDRFGQSGTSRELYKEYGLDYESIIQRIKDFVHKY